MTENKIYRQKLDYHFKPQKGWINDPNGLVYYKGMYHAFYQHCPDYEVPCQPMCWGHAVTKNFVDWQELPLALKADAEYDAGGCWSGTAAVKDDVLYLIYSSVINNGDAEPKWKQTVSIAYSEDGINFKKYENNPVIAEVPSDGSVKDFRDPAIICDNGVYYCVIATGHKETQTARLLLYKSDNLSEWKYVGVMKEWEKSAYAECPSFVRLNDKFLLAASVCPLEEEHYFELMYGDFKNGKFEIESSSRAFEGPDQYAGQVFRDVKGRDILIAWIPGWEYKNFIEKDIGCLSLPCEIKSENGKIKVFPVEEVRYLLKDEDPAVKVTEKGFIIEREGRTAVEYIGELSDLKILKDKYIVEVFVNGGEKVYTAVV